MARSSSSIPRGPASGPDAVGGVVAGVREAVERLRAPADLPEAGAVRVDVRAAVLSVLAEQPATGYEIVRALESRTPGARPPGAGAVYPTLQLLVDEGLATAVDVDGRRQHSLTDAGRVAAAAAGAPRGPDDRRGPADRQGRRSPARRGGLTRAGAQLVQTAALVGQTGTPEQVADAAAELDETRRRLLAILTRD